MIIRDFKPEDAESLAQLFYQTIRKVNIEVTLRFNPPIAESNDIKNELIV